MTPEFSSLMAQAWPLFAAAALGMAALYFLMPRPRAWTSARLAGAACTGLALAAAAVVGARKYTLTAEVVLFYCFAGLAVVAGGTMITRQNPARSALSFAVVVLSTTGLFLLQAAPFLMASTVIVYAGAIIVTFLFVIMLAQPGGASDADLRSREPLLATIAGFFLLATLLFVLRQTYTTGDLDALRSKVETARQPGADVRSALGERADFVARLERQADRFPAGVPAGEALRRQADVANGLWSAPSADQVRPQLDAMIDALDAARGQVGRYRPADTVKLSPLAGTPANQRPQGISADNVAGLGRTLFSDYLLAVEIAGTLLLVATVGAIAIAQRPVATRRPA